MELDHIMNVLNVIIKSNNRIRVNDYLKKKKKKLKNVKYHKTSW